MSVEDSKKYALILSGGSARGAYECGVLKYLYQVLPEKYGYVPDFKIICGTSVGAIHACFLAAHMHDIKTGLPKLIGIWENLKPSHVVGFGFFHMLSLVKLFYGGGKAIGLLDVRPLQSLLNNESDWDQISKNIVNNNIETLCISSTSTSTGKSIVFTETNKPLPGAGFRSHFVPVKMTSDHAMASAALPILFPAVKIDGEHYIDGGIRQNTPIAPAVAFDASHVFSIGLWKEPKELFDPNSSAPGVGALLGKIFNSFFLDNAEVDLYNLNFINSIITEGVKFAGKNFLKHIGNLSRPVRYIESCAISPSEDIGKIASQYISQWYLGKNWFWRALLRLIDVKNIQADFASYLLFDGEFAKLLIDLGYNDAAANEEQIVKFFGIK